MSYEFKDRGIVKKYLEIYRVVIFNGVKAGFEYKTNLVNLFLLDFVLFLTHLTFYYVYSSLVGDISNWEFKYFLAFNLFIMLFARMRYLHTFYDFSETLLSGYLNNSLVRPISSYMFASMKGINFGVGTLFTFLLFVIIMLFNLSLDNIFIALTIGFLGEIYYIVFIAFLNSTAFFMKNNHFIHYTFENKLNFVVEEFTPKFFYGTKFQYVAFLLPSAIYGFFAAEALRNDFTLLFEFLPYLLFSFLIMIVCIRIMWYYGLKNYEGFG